MANANRRCVTCKYLTSCKEVTRELIQEDQGCHLWSSHDELAKDAREELEIEFGIQAINYLTSHEQRAKRRKRKGKGAR